MIRVFLKVFLLMSICCKANAGFEVINAFAGLKFEKPLAIIQEPDEKTKLFIVEKKGKVYEIPNLSKPSKRLFLDISDVVISKQNEQGLLAMAFHPKYKENGHFYLFYNLKIEGKVYDQLSRFQMIFNDVAKVNLDSEQVLIRQEDQAWNHNGGDLHFGPDGYLYLSLGDEGKRDDRLNNSQTIEKDFYSGMIRIDVDKRSENLEPNPHPAIRLGEDGRANYSVPKDNPFIGASTYNGLSVDSTKVRTEFWATGLRNPWRFTFDGKKNKIYCGDVGQNAREEIDIIVKGGNYGWAYREASIDGFKSDQTPEGFTSIDPIFEYERNLGISVTGGVVVRGSRFPELEGMYVFADYAKGNIWTLATDTGLNETKLIASSKTIAGFGIDPTNGDVLMASLSGGKIMRLIVD